MNDTNVEEKDASTKMTIMENRIKRLLFEEERAKSLAGKARGKADGMLKNR